MEDVMQAAIERMRDQGAHFCDARRQRVAFLRIIVVDGSVRTLSRDTMGGLCLRVRAGGSWGYASCSTLEKKEVLAAADKAAVNARVGTAKGVRIPERKAVQADFKPNIQKHPDQVPLEEKLSLVVDLDKAQRSDERIVNSNAMYLEQVKDSLVMDSFGSSIKWQEVRGRLMAQSVSSDGQRMEAFYKMVDGTGGYGQFQGTDVGTMGRSCAEEAIKMLKAKKCPSGYHTCITDPLISGLLAHEVMGHASEGDEIVKKRSFLSEVVGKQVASELVTMVDDGTVPGAYGSIPFDDEGTPSSRTTMIDHGVYKGYMHSLETAAEMGVPPTGNGRAESTSRRVFVRMTNTYFEAGDWKLEEMIEGVKFGVLTDRAISGMEDPVGGGFEAQVLRGFLIENGRITDMLKGFAVTGKALEILKTTDAVGKEVSLDGGTCGKGIEDFVPVSSGGPHCRSKAILGGG